MKRTKVNVPEGQVQIGGPLKPRFVTTRVVRGVYPKGRYYKDKDGVRKSRGPARIIVTKSRVLSGYVTGPIRKAA